MPQLLPDNIKKSGAIMYLSDEQLFMALTFGDSRYERQHTRRYVEPTLDDAKAYQAARTAFAVLEDYKWMEWGGPDYGTEVKPPEGHWEYTYLETHEEWLDRCRALYKGEQA